MKKYIRFGEIPPNERSVNFIKMTLDQVDAFSWAIGAMKAEEAYTEYVPEKALEPGVSVFEMDKNGNPLLKNIGLVRSYCKRAEDEKAYIVTGDPVGTGHDGDILIKNVNIIGTHTPSDQTIINELKKHFSSRTFNPEEERSGFLSYCDWRTDEKQHSFRGWVFKDCIDDFCD